MSLIAMSQCILRHRAKTVPESTALNTSKKHVQSRDRNNPLNHVTDIHHNLSQLDMSFCWLDSCMQLQLGPRALLAASATRFCPALGSFGRVKRPQHL